MFWTLRLAVRDSMGNPVGDAHVSILDRNKKTALETKTDALGVLLAEFPEYSVDGKERTISSPYTIVVGKIRKEIDLDSNRSITMTIGQE